jgi:hypothetical protein
MGLAWYRREQWQRIRDISDDADDMHDSYEDWLSSAEQRFKEIKATGMNIQKVDIDSEQLILWCNMRGKAVDGKARSDYVSEKLRERDQPKP